MTAALDYADGRHQSELCIALEVCKIGHTAVAHGGLYLVNALFEVVVQRACIGDVGVNAFLEAELALAAEVIALPVARAV